MSTVWGVQQILFGSQVSMVDSEQYVLYRIIAPVYCPKPPAFQYNDPILNPTSWRRASWESASTHVTGVNALMTCVPRRCSVCASSPPWAGGADADPDGL